MLIRVPKDQIKSLRLALFLAEVKVMQYDKNANKDVIVLNNRIIEAIQNVLMQTWRKVKSKG